MLLDTRNDLLFNFYIINRLVVFVVVAVVFVVAAVAVVVAVAVGHLQIFHFFDFFLSFKEIFSRALPGGKFSTEV